MAATPATESIRRAGQVAWALVGLAAVVAIVGWLAWKVGVIFPPLILAGALVFLLNPLITFLQRRRVPRAAGVAITYLGFLGMVALIGLILYPAIRDQGENLSDKWPEIRQRIETWVDDRAESLQGTPFEFNRKQLTDAITSGDTSLRDQVRQATKIGIQVFHVLLVLILAPIFAFYLLVDLPHLRRTAEGLIPRAARDEVLHISRQVNQAVGGFFRGQLMVALIVGALSSVGMRIIDLPFWLLIGMVAGFFNLIPLIGPYIGAVPGIVIALTTREPITAVWVAAIMTGVQQIDNHFISPMVMHRAVKIHPVMVMVALLLGGTLFGFFGLLVAVPTAAVLKIVVGHLWRIHVLGQPLTEHEEAHEEVAGEEREGTGVVAKVPTEPEETALTGS
jgi:predicted PurR-regulated permease PerM